MSYLILNIPNIVHSPGIVSSIASESLALGAPGLFSENALIYTAENSRPPRRHTHSILSFCCLALEASHALVQALNMFHGVKSHRVHSQQVPTTNIRHITAGEARLLGEACAAALYRLGGL